MLRGGAENHGRIPHGPGDHLAQVEWKGGHDLPATSVLLHAGGGGHGVGRVLPHTMGGGHGLTLEVEADVEVTVGVNLEKEALIMLKEVPVQVDLEEKASLLLEKEPQAAR